MTSRVSCCQNNIVSFCLLRRSYSRFEPRASHLADKPTSSENRHRVQASFAEAFVFASHGLRQNAGRTVKTYINYVILRYAPGKVERWIAFCVFPNEAEELHKADETETEARNGLNRERGRLELRTHVEENVFFPNNFITFC